MLASITLRRSAALSVTVLLAAATVVASPQEATAGRQVSQPPKIQKAMKVAKRQIGDPYAYGASGPGSFDCSGFTSYSYGKAGISLPRTSGAQASAARSISRKKMRRGDLVFFHSGGSVYHVGIFWGWNNGNRIILDSPQPGESVGYTRIWTNSWFPGRVGPKRTVKPRKMLKPVHKNNTAKRTAGVNMLTTARR